MPSDDRVIAVGVTFTAEALQAKIGLLGQGTGTRVSTRVGQGHLVERVRRSGRDFFSLVEEINGLSEEEVRLLLDKAQTGGLPMQGFDMTRRAFVATAVGAGLARGEDPWLELFNGRDLEGWRLDKSTWKVAEGQLAGEGAGARLSYSGPTCNADFRNFELEVEALTPPGSDSRLCLRGGLEVQVGNTVPKTSTLPGGQKTGSLLGLRHIYKQVAMDDMWYKVRVLVRGRNVQVRLNGTLLVDLTERDLGRFADDGTLALRCEGAQSKVRYRSIRVRPLAGDLAGTASAPAPDDVARRIASLSSRGFPVVDYHVHLKEGLTIEEALARSRRDGIQYGIAVNCGKGFPISDDAGIRDFFDRMKGQPVFIAMQAEGREWTRMVSRSAVALFDYVFTDSMTWTDDAGKRMRLWIPEEVGTIADPQAFMDTLVARAVGILEYEPIDIYVNPTFLPDVLAGDYDRLWTEERMQTVVNAAARNQVAIELNDRYHLPSAAFVRIAKAAGCKFTFGTNNAGPGDLRRSEYGMRMVEQCKLEPRDIFMPGAWWPKAAVRKGSVLRV